MLKVIKNQILAYKAIYLKDKSLLSVYGIMQGALTCGGVYMIYHIRPVNWYFSCINVSENTALLSALEPFFPGLIEMGIN